MTCGPGLQTQGCNSNRYHASEKGQLLSPASIIQGGVSTPRSPGFDPSTSVPSPLPFFSCSLSLGSVTNPTVIFPSDNDSPPVLSVLGNGTILFKPGVHVSSVLFPPLAYCLAVDFFSFMSPLVGHPPVCFIPPTPRQEAIVPLPFSLTACSHAPSLCYSFFSSHFLGGIQFISVAQLGDLSKLLQHPLSTRNIFICHYEQ